MKRKTLFFLLGLLWLVPLSLCAYDFKSGDLYYNITGNSGPYTVEVTYESQYSSFNYSRLTTAIIPETVTYNGITYTVTCIGRDAFYGCSKLTSVTIPGSVTSIGSYAFDGCSSLTSVTILESVTSIGSSAFSGCTKLASVTIPESVTRIGYGAFENCSSLTSVTIPESVTSIGSSAFSGCTGLTSVTWNAKNYADISKYNYAPFYDVCSQITSFTFGNSVEHIPAYLCYGMSQLTSVTIPNNVTSIGNNAFYYVLNIVYYGSATSSPWGAQSINGYVDGVLVFDSEAKTQVLGCLRAATGEIVIPNTITSIGNDAFENCSGLTFVAIPASVTSIGDRAFSGCTSLTSITIPESITSIGYWAFFGCGLTSVTWNAKNCTGVSSYNSAPFYISSHIMSFTFGNSVEHIPAYLCYGMSQLTSVTIPESVTSIGYGAFENCSSLTSVTIPASVTSIGSSAFSGCTGLTSVTISESVTSIGNSAFSNSGITEIRFPENVTSIGSSALANCPVNCIAASMETPVSLSDNMIGSSRSPQNVSLVVPQSSIPLYQAAAYWKDFAIKTQAFSSRSVTTQATARVEATYLTTDSATHKRLGYVFAGDTIWNDNAQSDSVSFLIEGLAPSTDYEFYLVADSVWVDEKIEVIADSCDGTQWNEWSTVYWTSDNQHYSLYGSTSTSGRDDYLYRTITLEAGVKYTFSINARKSYYPLYSSASLTMSIGNEGQYTTLLNVRSLNKSATTYLATFTPTETKEYTMRLLGHAPSSGNVYVDNIFVTHTLWKTGLYSQCASFKTQAVKFNVKANTTQTTAHISLGIDCGDVSRIDRCGFTYYQSEYSGKEDTIFFETTEPIATLDTIVAGLIPYTEYHVIPFVDIEGTRYSRGTYSYFTTKDISVTLTCGTSTQTTIPLTLKYDFDDADALNTGINGIEYCLGSQFTEDSDIQTIPINSMDSALLLDTIVRGLIPNTQYTFRPYVNVESTGRKYGTVKTARTKSVSLNGSRTDRTQTTLSLQFTYNFGDADIDYIDGTLGDVQSFRFYPASSTGTIDTTFTHLRSGTEYTLSARAILTSGVSCGSTSGTYTTLPVSLGTPSVTEYGQTYVVVNSSYDYGDATLLRNILEFKRSQSSSAAIDTTINIIGAQTKINNLLPNTTYYYRHLLETSEGGTQTTDWQEFATLPITLTTQSADGISNTSALLHGTVDCDQESYTEIGFEWKRSDAPATVRPQRLLVTDRVDENLLFRLEGLSSDRYYDFRTFCSYQGETYYGEWVGLLTSDKEVLVAPTVQTVGATANEQGAEMEGFIVTGTEPILQKGFEVWIKGGTDVKTTVAEGRIIRALIPEPWSYTTYQYKAYAKTASGTTYGETMEITTGYIPRDVQDIVVTPSSNSAEVTWTEIEVADYYILTLFADEAMTDTLAVYQVGTDGSISRLRMPSVVKALVTCNIDDLTPATDYYFAVVAYNSADQKVAEENGTFQTEPDATSIRPVTDGQPESAVRKILYRGQVFILRNGKVYTLTGQEIR